MQRVLTPLACVMAILVGLAVYWPGVHGGFLFDDFANLVNDPDWKATSLSASELHRAMSLGIASESGRPLALLSFAINHAFSGLDPLPLKLTGLGLHLFNGALVILLCSRLFALAPTLEARERLGTFAATLVAIAWVVHPLQVSSALYIVQRMEVGAHTGVLLSLLCYLKARQQQIQGRLAWPWFVLVSVSVILGLGFKETALLVPGYTLAIEMFVFRFQVAEKKRSTTLRMTYLLGAAAAVAAYLLFIVPKYLPPAAYAFRDFTLVERLLTQPVVLTTYLGQMLLPLPANLLFYYDHFPVSQGLLKPAATLTSLLTLAAFATAGWLARRRWPIVSLGIAWFFVAHILTSNVIPLELAFEHRNYFALLGVILATAQVLAWAGARLHMDARRTLAILPVLLLAALCLIQTHTWGDPFRLATTLASRNPLSARASYDLGRVMLQMAGTNKNSPLLDLAAKEFEHARGLVNAPPLAEQALIMLKSRTDQDVPAEIWNSFRLKLAKRPAGVEEIAALHGILDCRIKNHCDIDDQQLLSTLLVALEQNPESATVRTLYASLAANVLGDRELAVSVTRDTIRLHPNNLQYRVNLARLLAAQGDTGDEFSGLVEQIRRSDEHGRFTKEVEEEFRLPSRPPE